MVEDHMALIQEHNPEMAANSVEWIKGMRVASVDSEDWAMQMGRTIVAMVGRISEYHSHDSIGAAFVAYYGKRGLL